MISFHSFVKFLVVVIGFSLTGCLEESQETRDFLVRVNDYKISEEDIDRKIKVETELDSNFYLSDDTRTEFVKDLIQTQLFIQEAKREKLDEQEKFRKTIERYWESTLIRDLLAKKTEQLRKTTVISQAEIATYFKENKKEFNQNKLDELSGDIRLLLENEKISLRLEEWVEELRNTAKIEIKDVELSTKVLSGGD